MLAEKQKLPSLPSLRDLVEEELCAVLELSAVSEPLRSAVRYAVLGGGKRIRPLFVLGLALDIGRDPLEVLHRGVALELVHCSTLVHDDLPALDDDDFRRNQPSCHKKFGEATAVLAGDYLIGLAQQCVATSRGGIEDRFGARASAMLAKSFCDVCEGQQIDILERTSINQILDLHLKKTASLFRTALSFAVLGHPSEQELAPLANELGKAVGLYFQAADDFIDVYGGTCDRGRPESSDARNERQTLFSQDHKEEGQRLLMQHEDEVQIALAHLLAALPTPTDAPLFSLLMAQLKQRVYEVRNRLLKDEPTK